MRSWTKKYLRAAAIGLVTMALGCLLFVPASSLGLFAAFDMPDGETRGKVRALCMKKGLIILPSGERSIRFRPPLNVTAQEIDAGVALVTESLREL